MLITVLSWGWGRGGLERFKARQPWLTALTFTQEEEQVGGGVVSFCAGWYLMSTGHNPESLGRGTLVEEFPKSDLSVRHFLGC